MSRGFSGGKQKMKFANARNRFGSRPLLFFKKWWINRVFRSIGGFLVREVVSLFPLMEATVSFNDLFDSFAHLW